MTDTELGPLICAAPWKRCGICFGWSKRKRRKIYVRPHYALWDDPYYPLMACQDCDERRIKAWGYTIKPKQIKGDGKYKGIYIPGRDTDG